MTANKRTSGILAMVAILSVFIVGQATFIVNPALNSLAEQFSNVSYSTVLLISTLPSLIVLPASIIGGSIAGTKVKYKTLCLFAIVLALVAGVIPYFLKNFYAILVARAIFGIGYGISTPVANALPIAYFDKNRASTLLGIGTTIQCAGGMAIQAIAGIICAINVNYTWLVHLYLAIPLLLVLLFMPMETLNQDTPADAETASEDAPKSKSKLPASVFVMSIAFGLLFIAFYPLILNMSAIIVGENLGTAAAAGTVLSMYSVGGFVSLFFGAIYKVLNKKTIPVCLLVLIISLLLCYFGTNIALLMIASILGGAAMYVIMPALMMQFGEMLPPNDVATASGIMTACVNFGVFLASPYIGLVATVTGNSNPRLPLLIGAIITLIIAIPWTIMKLKEKQ